MSSASDNSIYTPLEDWQTRILAIHPGTFGQPTTADLYVVDIIQGDGVVIHSQQRRIEYKALSYCWGDAIFDHEITCNGQSFNVTSNVYGALQSLRTQDGRLYLWIDAICIDQQNVPERSRQVSDMLTIFSKAAEVVVWLGKTADGFSAGQTELAESLIDNSLDGVKTLESSAQTSFLRSCQSTAANPWFRRVWVRQEVWAATSLTVRIGQVSVQWDLLVRAFATAEQLLNQSFPDLRRTFHPTFASISAGFVRPLPRERLLVRLGDQRNVFLSPTNTSDIHSLLSRNLGSLCTDPRDFVYGLLGMSSTIKFIPGRTPSTEASLFVDYRKSVAQVFQDVARYIVQRDGVLNILYLDASYGGQIGESELPSWCPDWTKKHEQRPWLNESNISLDYESFAYSSLHDDEASLLIKGFHLKTIESIESEISDAFGATVDELPPSVEATIVGVARPDTASTSVALQDLNEFLSIRSVEDIEEKFCRNDVSLKLDIYSHGAWVKAQIPRSYIKFDRLVRRPVPLHPDIRRVSSTCKHLTYLKTNRPSSELLPKDRERFRNYVRATGLYDELPPDKALFRQGIHDEIWTAPPQAQAGDIIIVPHGGFHPIVVRPLDDFKGERKVKFIGPTTLATAVSPKSFLCLPAPGQNGYNTAKEYYKLLDLRMGYEKMLGVGLETFRLV